MDKFMPLIEIENYPIPKGYVLNIEPLGISCLKVVRSNLVSDKTDLGKIVKYYRKTKRIDLNYFSLVLDNIKLAHTALQNCLYDIADKTWKEIDFALCPDRKLPNVITLLQNVFDGLFRFLIQMGTKSKSYDFMSFLSEIENQIETIQMIITSLDLTIKIESSNYGVMPIANSIVGMSN